MRPAPSYSTARARSSTRAWSKRSCALRLELCLGHFLDLTGIHDALPDRQHRHLEQAGGLRPRLGDLLRVPVALPLLLVGEDRQLGEVERIVARPEERPEGGAVVEYRLGGGPPGV